MNQYQVVYQGYRNGDFVFITKSGAAIKLKALEITPIFSETEIIKVMNGLINHVFIVGVYPVSHGYFVKERFFGGRTVYDIYDAETKVFAGITINDKEDIPKELNGKRISIYGKKSLLSKLS